MRCVSEYTTRILQRAHHSTTTSIHALCLSLCVSKRLDESSHRHVCLEQNSRYHWVAQIADDVIVELTESRLKNGVHHISHSKHLPVHNCTNEGTLSNEDSCDHKEAYIYFNVGSDHSSLFLHLWSSSFEHIVLYCRVAQDHCGWIPV